MLKLQQVADLLDIGKRTLERWIAKETFPRADFSHKARVKRWFPSTIRAWVDANGGPLALTFVSSRSNVGLIKTTNKRKEGIR